MFLLKTKNYMKASGSLSKKDQVFLSKQEEKLAKDIFDSTLHTKKLKGFSNDKVYSFRISRAYRGIFRLDAQNVILFAIGHRKDVYQSIE